MCIYIYIYIYIYRGALGRRRLRRGVDPVRDNMFYLKKCKLKIVFIKIIVIC